MNRAGLNTEPSDITSYEQQTHDRKEGSRRMSEVRYRPPVLKSEEENRDLANLMRKSGEPWLGMEATGNNFFKWIYGTSVSTTFSAWKTGEPNNPGVENCAYMYVDQKKNGKGGNNPCMDAVYSVFCQKKKQNHRFLSLVTIDCKPDSRKYLLLVPN